MIAVIAGTGSLPLDACTSLLARNETFFVINLFPEDNAEHLYNILHQHHVPMLTLPFYKVGAILDTLKEQGTKKVLFIGKVDKRNLFKKFKFDWLFFKIAARIAYKTDKAIMEEIIAFLDEHQIEVIPQHAILDALFVPPGILCGTLTPELEKDIIMGLELAKTISLHNIGQTVVVKDSIILAVEAIEGTDECIQRGIKLGKEMVVVCKAARLDQNKKFDLPTLGPQSLQHIKPGQIHAIAWQSHQTFITQKDLFIQYAQERGITLVSV